MATTTATAAPTTDGIPASRHAFVPGDRVVLAGGHPVTVVEWTTNVVRVRHDDTKRVELIPALNMYRLERFTPARACIATNGDVTPVVGIAPEVIDAAEVIYDAGLSESQRAALMTATRSPLGMHLTAPARTVTALSRRGLLTVDTRADGHLTPLGHAVRALLRGEPLLHRHDNLVTGFFHSARLPWLGVDQDVCTTVTDPQTGRAVRCAHCPKRSRMYAVVRGEVAGSSRVEHACEGHAVMADRAGTLLFAASLATDMSIILQKAHRVLAG